MAVSAHRNLNDLLMSWLANVYTPWNAARWLGDASDWIPGARSFRMSDNITIPTYLDFVQCQSLWFPRSMLVAQFWQCLRRFSVFTLLLFHVVFDTAKHVLPL